MLYFCGGERTAPGILPNRRLSPALLVARVGVPTCDAQYLADVCGREVMRLTLVPEYTCGQRSEIVTLDEHTHDTTWRRTDVTHAHEIRARRSSSRTQLSGPSASSSTSGS